uniref:SWIM-type domain-containing protein n=2 Tax=viral metagenome TaxID=1070528 RepID=A0A6M3LUJ5_9ZZZZ
MKYLNQWIVPSDSDPNRNYTISLTYNEEWQCSCRGWTSHVPRRDCKHIRRIKEDPEALKNGVRFSEATVKVS